MIIDAMFACATLDPVPRVELQAHVLRIEVPDELQVVEERPALRVVHRLRVVLLLELHEIREAGLQRVDLRAVTGLVLSKLPMPRHQ